MGRVPAMAHGIVPTSPERPARRSMPSSAIESVASSEAWGRVVGLVVQPGLSFRRSHRPFQSWVAGSAVTDPRRLSGLCFEAFDRLSAAASLSGTRPPSFRDPEWTCSDIRLSAGPCARPCQELVRGAKRTRAACRHDGADARGARQLGQALSRTAEDVRRLRHFGYADRIRYYWNRPEAEAAIRDLIASLEERRLLVPMLEQYFSQDVIARAEGLAEYMPSWPRALILATVQEALLPYFKVGPGGADSR